MQPNHTENEDFVSTAEKRNDEVYDRILLQHWRHSSRKRTKHGKKNVKSHDFLDFEKKRKKRKKT